MLSLGPLELHKMLSGFDDKSAQAVCTFGYCAGPGHEPITFQGRTDGKLVASRGPTVFGKWTILKPTLLECRALMMEPGWDSCFETQNGQTYAEMDKAEKNKISHRGKALEKLKAWLASQPNA